MPRRPISLCPTCGAPGVPIAYGMPGPEMSAAAERSEIILGGCMIEPDQPTHQCRAKHRWQDERTG
ncbi:MAG: hypothetical protein ACSLFP_15105 [Acidimicrobiales bacterium]